MFRQFPSETVVLNLQTGLYHGLNPTAGRMLEALVAEGDVASVSAMLAAEYEVPVERVREDVERLVDQLLERQLVVERAADGPPGE